MSLIFIIAISVCGLLALYLGKRLKVWFEFRLSGINCFIYWIVIIFACSLLIVSRLLSVISNYWFPLIGNFLFAIVICAIYVLIIFDFIRLVTLKRLKPNVLTKIAYTLSVIGLFLYGHQMATKPNIVYYQVNINKPAKVDHLRLVQVSDIHISEVTSNQFIEQLVNDINQLSADFIFVTGDTIDNRLAPFINKGFDRQLSKLESTYGTYIIFGNHEYINTQAKNNSDEDIIKAYESANMRVLKDDVLTDNNLGITIIGRDDFAVQRHGLERSSLSDLLIFTDATKPIILLDHQPKNLDEAERQGIDLMLSGHTHQGQVFPMNFLVDSMYPNGYGMYQSLSYNFTSIVSSGYGLWGPPIRLMTRSEIVVIDVNFTGQSDEPLLHVEE